MVATRGTDQTVSFITGNSRIDPSTIRVEQWVEIVRSAIDVIPINYMRGLRPVKEILQHGEMEFDGYMMDLRRVPPSLPSIPIKTLDGSKKLLRGNDVFLHCGEVSDLPWGTSASERWKKAPRLAAAPEEAMLLPVASYLLSREKKLYYMLTEWQPHERWDDEAMHSTPEEFWYAPQVTLFEELDDARLDAYLANGSKRDIAKVMLHRIHQALVRTASEMQGQYIRTLEKQHIIGGYLDRFGELAH
jgi:hypothetical protein